MTTLAAIGMLHPLRRAPGLPGYSRATVHAVVPDLRFRWIAI
jgi:hypothetical protein